MTLRKYISGFISFLFCFIYADNAFAQIDDIAVNIAESVTSLPAFATALSYISGLLIGIWGILKLVENNNNPAQVPLRVPLIRLLVAGALFALPIIVESTVTAISGDVPTIHDTQDDNIVVTFSNALGQASGVIGFGNLNTILDNIVDAIEDLPALVAVVAYLLGILLTLSAIYQARDHVDDPDRVPLKDVVIRFLIAGALFSLPTIFNATYDMIEGGGIGFLGVILNIFSLASFLISGEAALSIADPTTTGCVPGLHIFDDDLGGVICSAMFSSVGLPAFLTVLSYLLGLAFGFWAIIKIRDHVVDPSRTALHEGVSRLVASGAFFAMPTVALAIQSSVTPVIAAGFATAVSNAGFNEVVTCEGTNSLDEAMSCFMLSTLGPTLVALKFFAFVAGLIFIMIGISRLVKTAQEGARGPGGLGTLTTFVVGGLLLSSNGILKAVSVSLFNVPVTATQAELIYTEGMDPVETQAVYNVVSAVLKFLIVIGSISFVRGIFIMRDVAEGDQQASSMAGITHIVGGALAVNLGPLLNAVQQTLGVTAFGVTFGFNPV